jgi:hypothetical protein
MIKRQRYPLAAQTIARPMPVCWLLQHDFIQITRRSFPGFNLFRAADLLRAADSWIRAWHIFASAQKRRCGAGRWGCSDELKEVHKGERFAI